MTNPPGDPASFAHAARELADVVDAVPAAETVLIEVASPGALVAIKAQLQHVRPASTLANRQVVEIPTTYDGADLDAVADMLDLDVADVVRQHCEASYRVAFVGFAPGFGYLDGLPVSLHLPRRSSPRHRVPAGSVAIAAQYSAVYPQSSPGGWHLIGSTSVAMFDPQRTPAALLSPGTEVRFVPQ